jgi:hypothetical protein
MNQKLKFPGLDPLVDDMPEELRRIYDEAERITGAVAQSEAKRIDDEITAAITMRLGHTNWKPMQMTGRLHRTIYLDGSEVMVLDGIPFMHIGPWKFPPYGLKHLGATREITHLKGADDVLPN